MKYIRMHQVEAEPMTRGDYNKYRGWEIPANENPADEGYLVTYPDGYISWCPKAQFENNAFSDAKDAPFRSIPDPDQLLMLLRIFHDERYSNCSGDEKATRLVHAYYNEYVGHPNGFLTFGQAIEAMKSGKKVARNGWRSKGKFLWIKPQVEIQADWCKDPMLKKIAEENGGTILGVGVICLFTPDSLEKPAILNGWTPLQCDMLANDWAIVE